MVKKIFERAKSHINIVTTGCVNREKMTLTTAITKTLSLNNCADFSILPITLEGGNHFATREGGRNIDAGVIIEILE